MDTRKTLASLFEKGLLRQSLQIGTIAAVSANIVRMNMPNATSPTGIHYEGGRYGKGEVGEFVLIEAQQGLLLGRIIEVRLSERDLSNNQKRDSMDVLGIVQLLGTVSIEDLRVTAGVDAYPRIGDHVYSAPHPFLAAIPILMNPKKSDVTLNLGSVDVAHESNVEIPIEKIFGRHCAILGATGGGKSWTTAHIIEECMKYQSKIILIDATGEYQAFSGDHIEHCCLGYPDCNCSEDISHALPPTCFQESDFIALFEPSGKVQGPKLRDAIRSLRLINAKPELATNGILKKIDQPKSRYLEAINDPDIASTIDNPYKKFDCTKLIHQIEQECVYPDAFGISRGAKDTTKWGGDDGQFSFCLPLTTRINCILRSRALSCVFSKKENSITDKINEFVSNDHKKLLRICLSGIHHEFNAREIIANVLGRFLLSKARKGKFKEKPVVVILDEAHNFLGRFLGTEDSRSKLDAFELIAKEGRKFGLTICLATQRPRDITEGVLSQMGTLIVHRLTNDRDREVVERACGEIDRSASAFLPSLKPGEAAIIGVDFPIPLTVQIKPPQCTLTSNGPNYQDKWANKHDLLEQEFSFL
jgi:uncharacterized protein